MGEYLQRFYAPDVLAEKTTPFGLVGFDEKRGVATVLFRSEGLDQVTTQVKMSDTTGDEVFRAFTEATGTNAVLLRGEIDPRTGEHSYDFMDPQGAVYSSMGTNSVEAVFNGVAAIAANSY